MRINPELSNQVIEYLIKMKTNVVDALFSSEESSNVAYKNLIVESINQHIQSNEKLLLLELKGNPNSQEIITKSPIFELLDYLLALLSNNEAAKNWTKICAYLEVKKKN